MRKIGWHALSALVIVIGLGCVLLLAANLYVQSQAVQQRIRHALSAVLRMPVSIKKTTITPWEGLRIDGLTAREDSSAPFAKEAAVSADYLLAASFRVRFALWPLLTKRQVIIDEVLLDRPQVAWAQDEQGRWQLPPEPGVSPKKTVPHGRAKPALTTPTPAALPATQSSDAPEPVLAQTSPPSPAKNQGVVPGTSATKQDVATQSINKVRLRHGDLAFLNNKRHQVGHFEEVDVDGKLADLDHAAGTVGFATANLPRVGLTLTKFQSDFKYGHDEGLALSNGRAELAGGEVTADYHLRTDEPESPFTLECRLDNISLGQLIREAGSHAKLLEGRLQGGLQASGLSDNPESRIASGQIELLHAKVRDFPILKMLGEMLRIDDLTHLELKTAQLDYRLDGTVLQVDPLTLVSNDLGILAQGKYDTANDRLDLHARLTVDAAVSRQLPPSVLQQFLPDAAIPGSRYIDFAVTGPAGKPNTDLYKRILAPQVNDLLQSLLSSKPKSPKEKFLKRAAPPLPNQPPAVSSDQ